MKDIHYIYKISNTVNNTVYIGQTADLDNRWKQHLKNTYDTTKVNSLYMDMKEFGVDKFNIEIIDTCFERHKFIIEEYWINIIAKETKLYNINIGSKLGESTKNKIRTKRIENKTFDYSSESFKSKMSTVTSGSKNGMYGKSCENAVNGQYVFMYDIDKVLVKEFNSVASALAFIGMKGHVGLIEACRSGTLYKNHYWSKTWSNK